MKNKSMYLDWYVKIPKVKYDLRSSGINYFNINLKLSNFDLSVNYDFGNPLTRKIIASRYGVKPDNIFVSSEGASGQNARIIRFISEKNPDKKEVIVEYPTYEPLLRLAQEYFLAVKRVERIEEDDYTISVGSLKKVVSKKTGLLIITNPHAPTGAILDKQQIKEIMNLANEYRFYVICDEIYSEFNRKFIPTVYSVDKENGITTTGFSKCYGLGGLKLGVSISKKELTDELYIDSLNSVGNHPNIVQYISYELFKKNKKDLDNHLKKWDNLKKETENFLDKNNFEYFPCKVGITYWIKTKINDTHQWVNKKTLPSYGLVVVPGAFFLYRYNYKLKKSNMIRIGLGNINPEKPNLNKTLNIFKKAFSQ